MTGVSNIERDLEILIVEDDKREGQHAIRYLRKATAETKINFELLNPDEVGGLDAFLRHIVTRSPSAVLIDHRLGEQSGAIFSGLELAASLRAVKPMLPIFILTKYAQASQLERKGFALDDVMEKDVLRRNATSYTGRLLRAMRRYEEATDIQSRRMHELTAVSLERELSAVEISELNKIRAEIGLLDFGIEVQLNDQARRRLESKQNILGALRELLADEQ